MALRKWKKFFITLLLLAKDISPKGKIFAKTVSFCCLVTFLRKHIKDVKLIICDKI